MPSFDNDLLDFGLRVPLSLKYGQNLYRKAFAKAFPEIAKIPKTGDHLPINSSQFRIKTKFYQSKLEGRIKKIPFFTKIYSNPKFNQNYVNYDLWTSNIFYEDIFQSFNSSTGTFLNKNQALHLLEKHKNSSTDYSFLLWQLINLGMIENA
jgi:hypothetical protein